MKKKLFCILDVETSGSLGWPLIYDIAYKIVDKYGREYVSRNFIIRDVFQNPELMCKAYYAKKYYEEYPLILRDPSVEFVYWQEFIKEFNADMKIVDVFCAYNAAFDLRAMRLTDFWERFGIDSKEQLLKFLNRLKKNGHAKKAKQLDNYQGRYKIPSLVYDIYLGSAQQLMTSRDFRKTAFENLWITPNGNISSTAQVAWRWISGNHSFIEAHTSMEDVEIETELLFRILAKKQKMLYNTLHPACIVSRAVQGKQGMYFHERNRITFSNYLGNRAKEIGLELETREYLSRKLSYETVVDLNTGEAQEIPVRNGKMIEVRKNLSRYDNIEHVWETALNREITDQDKTTQQGRHNLLNEFFKKVGVHWRDFKLLPTNFQIIALLDARSVDWRENLANPEDEIEVTLRGKQLHKYLEERSRLEESHNISGHIAKTISQISDDNSEDQRFIS